MGWVGSEGCPPYPLCPLVRVRKLPCSCSGGRYAGLSQGSILFVTVTIMPEFVVSRRCGKVCAGMGRRRVEKCAGIESSAGRSCSSAEVVEIHRNWASVGWERCRNVTSAGRKTVSRTSGAVKNSANGCALLQKRWRVEGRGPAPGTGEGRGVAACVQVTRRGYQIWDPGGLGRRTMGSQMEWTTQI